MTSARMEEDQFTEKYRNDFAEMSNNYIMYFHCLELLFLGESKYLLDLHKDKVYNLAAGIHSIGDPDKKAEEICNLIFLYTNTQKKYPDFASIKRIFRMILSAKSAGYFVPDSPAKPSDVVTDNNFVNRNKMNIKYIRTCVCKCIWLYLKNHLKYLSANKPTVSHIPQNELLQNVIELCLLFHSVFGTYPDYNLVLRGMRSEYEYIRDVIDLLKKCSSGSIPMEEQKALILSDFMEIVEKYRQKNQNSVNPELYQIQDISVDSDCEKLVDLFIMNLNGMFLETSGFSQSIELLIENAGETIEKKRKQCDIFREAVKAITSAIPGILPPE